MNWLDLTHPLSAAIPTWEDSEAPQIKTLCEIGPDCPVRVSHIATGMHTGTHLDAPAHFLADGSMVESIPLESLIGPCWICETGDAAVVDAATLETLSIPATARRILFRTSNTARGLMRQPKFDRSYVGLDASGAAWLRDRGVVLVGFDYLSIQAFEAPDRTHRLLLAENVVLVEGLDLDRVSQGWYDLVCLPLLAKDVEGAPARVVARRQSP